MGSDHYKKKTKKKMKSELKEWQWDLNQSDAGHTLGILSLRQSMEVN